MKSAAKISGIIAMLRIVTLGARFALTVYITAVMGLVDVGRFGLVSGAALILPPVIGFGLNFHLFRELVGEDRAERIVLLRHGLGAHVAVLGAATALAAAAWLTVGGRIDALALLVVSIVWCETLGLDLYLALTSLRANVAANVSVAIRTAGWVPIVMIAGLLQPEWRTLEVVLVGWLGGGFANLAFVTLWLRREQLWRALFAPGHEGWVRRTLPAAMAIWPSDMALVAITFGDRFILSGMVSASALGLYVYYWTFANAVQTLIQTSVLTPALPRLVLAHRVDARDWAREVARIAAPAAGASVALALAVLAVIWLGARFVPALKVPWSPWVALPVFVAAIVRLVADFYSLALNSAGRVRDYAMLNIGYAVMTLAACWAGARVGGVGAAALAMAIASALFLALRRRAVLAETKRAGAAV